MSEFKEYLILWEGAFIAPFSFSNSTESRTSIKAAAQRFKSIRSAQLRIAKIRKIRKITNYEIIEAE